MGGGIVYTHNKTPANDSHVCLTSLSDFMFDRAKNKIEGHDYKIVSDNPSHDQFITKIISCIENTIPMIKEYVSLSQEYYTMCVDNNGVCEDE